MDASTPNPAKAQPDEVEIFLPSTLGYEKVARSAAQAVAEEMGFSPDRIEDLKTAVSEACMNAIEHGNQEDKTTSVTVLLTAASKQLEIMVKDEGLSPIPDKFPPPGRPDEDNRGWGIFFISQLVDEVEIKRLPEGGNQVRMVIYLTPEPAKEDKQESTDTTDSKETKDSQA
jgi:serine/threonine-protein kinase RsbW